MTGRASRFSKPGRALAATLALAGLLPVAAWAAPSAADLAVADAERQVARAATPEALLALAAGFMRKARETGDPSYYARAGAAVERVLAADPVHYGALRARAWILLGKHAFAGAARAARRARRLEPRDWWNYGNLADACMELGYYRCATHATARMTALRPGLPAYTRVAAVRAVSGDRAGAVEALELALRAADPRDPEERAWVLTHLGHEHWALGDVPRATACYEAALTALPDYHLTLPALARARAAEGRTADAVVLYERALDVAPTAATAGALGDLQAALGNPDAARGSYALASYMGRVATSRGQSYGRELALFLADHDRDLDDALALVAAESAARDDVQTNDVLAWVRFKRGELAAAKRSAGRALRLGTQEATFHRHAQAIAAALGRPRVAARHARAAAALEPDAAPRRVGAASRGCAGA
jgi:tetratricopeptide (TPR) repeat protein